MSGKSNAYVCLTLAMAVVGSSIVVGKLMVQTMPVFLASGIRFGVASLVLVLLLYGSEKGIPKLRGKEIGILLLQSFSGVFLFSICLLYGVQFTTASESGIITSTTPLMIGLLAYFILKEKIGRGIWIGIVFAVLGLLVINLTGVKGEERGSIPWLGNLLVLLAVVGESLFTILGKQLSERLSSLTIATFVSVFGFILFLPFALYEAYHFSFQSASPWDWFYVMYYAIVVTVIAFYLWYYGVSKVSGGISGVFTAVLPVTTLVLSYIILKEQFLWTHLLGIMLVIAGIFFSALFPYLMEKREVKHKLTDKQL